MSDLIPQLIIWLSGTRSPPLLLLGIFSGFPNASPQRDRPRVRILSVIREARGVAGLTLFTEAADPRAPEDERR
jgi:hypothetical protein